MEYDPDLGEYELVVTRKTYQDQEYTSYNVPVAHLKNLDLARQEVAQRKEAMRLREMAQLEAKLKELRRAT